MRFQIKKPKRMIFNKTKKTFRNKLKRKRKTTTITRSSKGGSSFKKHVHFKTPISEIQYF